MSIGSDPRIQAIIEAYREGEYDPYYQQNKFEVTPGQFYNPIYDIRTEQIKAGELEEGARFPKMDMEEKKEEEKQEEPFDPCPPGYQLVGGVCQPDTMFQQGGGGRGGQQPEVPSGYAGDINLRMANDPVNTELRRFAAQEDYQPTFGSTLQDLFRKGMQLSPMMGLLNALGLGPSYTSDPYMPTGASGFNPLITPEKAAQMRENQLFRAQMTRDLLDQMTQAQRAKSQGAGSFTVGKDRKPIKGTGFEPRKAGQSIAGERIRGGI